LNQRSDFRSDTVTLPTEAMRRAMASAPLGDDVLDGDPTVARLEARVAEWLGKERAIFVPTGTMANQCALGAWTRSGDEIVCEESAHVLLWEGGALGANHGVQAVTLREPRGAFDPQDLQRLVRTPSIHSPRTALFCVEQSTMGSGSTVGGHVIPLENLEGVRAVGRANGVPVHMDGARLANAVVASGVAADRFAALADSVAVCFSKGLGAPVGSAVAGDGDFVERARVVRKRLGGWMRQAGMLAAAALYGLDRHVERLAQDHALARRLAEVVDGVPGLDAPPGEVETNIVCTRVDPQAARDVDAAELARALDARGVSVLTLEPHSIRFVTHMGVGSEDVERVAGALAEIFP
jgi:threonine aldolase